MSIQKRTKLYPFVAILVAFVMFIAGAVLLSAPALPSPQTVYASENSGGGLPVFYDSATGELRFTVESSSGFPFGGSANECTGNINYNEAIDIPFDGLAKVVGNTIEITGFVLERSVENIPAEECVYFSFVITVFSDDGIYALLDGQTAEALLDGVEISWLDSNFGMISDENDEFYFLIVSLCGPSGPLVSYDPETNLLQFTIKSLIDFPFGNDAFVISVGIDYNDGNCYTDGNIEFISIDVVGNTMTVIMPVMEIYDGDLEAACTRFWCEISIQSGDDLYVFWSDELALDIYSWGGWSISFNKSNIGVEWDGETCINHWIVFLGEPYVLDICEDLHTVTFLDKDGGTIAISSLDYGTIINANSITAPTVPGQTFAGWQLVSGDPVGAPITQDTVLRATYSNSKYTVTFQNKDGGTITTTTLDYGTIISTNSVTAPTVTGYTFAYWLLVGGNPIGAAITQNTVLRAVYSINQYTVTFKDENGVTLKAVTLDYGTIISTDSVTAPTVTGRTFAGWQLVSGDPIGAAIAQDTVLKAAYEISTYTLTILGYDDVILHTINFPYGDFHYYDLIDYDLRYGITLPEVENMYFAGWEFEHGDEFGSFLRDNRTIKAIYLPITFTVSFHSSVSGLIEEVALIKGEIILLIDPPHEAGYTFSHWEFIFGDPVGSPITQDTSLIAIYIRTSFTVTYLSDKDAVRSIATLYKGELISAHEDWEMDYDNNVFIGWSVVIGDDVGTPITQDTVLRAVYIYGETFTVTFLGIKSIVLAVHKYSAGTIIRSYEFPAVEGYILVNQEVISGDAFDTPITQDTVIQAVYLRITPTLMFRGKDGTILSESELDYGAIIVAITAPKIEGYTFSHWELLYGDDIDTPITQTTVFRAVYTANLVTYTVEVYKQQSAGYNKFYIATHTYSVEYGSRFTVELWFAESEYHDGYEFRHYTGSAPYPLVGGEEFTVYLKEFDNTVTIKLWLPLGVTSINYSVLLGETFNFSNLGGLVDSYMGAGNGEIMSITRADGKELDALFTADTVVNVHVFVRISVTYYSLERLYYTKQNTFLWLIPTGTEYKYSDFIVKRTDYYWVGVGPEPTAPDFDSLIQTGLYGAKRYASVPGFKFLGWDNTREDLLPGLRCTHYTALYEIPKITIEYYGSNGKYVETRYIDPYFVPVTEVNFDWLEAFEKYFQDVLIKLDLFEFVDDAQARLKAKELVKYVSEAYKQDLFEVYFMVARPTVNIESAFGIFKSASAAPISSTFKYLCGASVTDDYVYYADLTNVYLNGIKYNMRVTFDTPYDNAVNAVKDTWDWLKTQADDLANWLSRNLIMGGISLLAFVLMLWLAGFILMKIFGLDKKSRAKRAARKAAKKAARY